MDTTNIKLSLLSFLEQKGAYNANLQVRLPGGHWADLQEFMQQSGAQESDIEELLQQMRSNWQVAALWLNRRWLAFYTPLGHQELNRLRGSDTPPPKPLSAPDEAGFWLELEKELRGQGWTDLAQQVAQLSSQTQILQATRKILQTT